MSKNVCRFVVALLAMTGEAGLLPASLRSVRNDGYILFIL
jgi:hypothetical protein